jgi:uncharacterized membrane protein YkgB
MLRNFLLLAIIIAWMQGLYLALAVFSKVMGLDSIFILHGSNFDKFSDAAFSPLITIIYLCILLWITIYKKVKHEHLAICFLICACGWLSNLFLDNSLFGVWPFLSALAFLKFNTNNKHLEKNNNLTNKNSVL